MKATGLGTQSLEAKADFDCGKKVFLPYSNRQLLLPWLHDAAVKWKSK